MFAILELFEELFNEFKPLFKVRYSATHKKGKEYNKIYRLDAIDAYNQKLVKKINVKGIEVLHNKSEDTYLFLDSVNISQKHDPEAIMEIEVKSSNGVFRKLMKIKAGDDLYTKSGELQQYKGYVVSEIDGRYDQYDKVFFTNGVEIQVGQAFGDVDESHIIRIQIRETIRSHFEKEKELHKLGIKVLSLFFIDEVAKYKYYEEGSALKGDYAKIFEEEYNRALMDYRTLFDEEYVKYLDSFETGKIHAGYFSIDKKGHEVDPSINESALYVLWVLSHSGPPRCREGGRAVSGQPGNAWADTSSPPPGNSLREIGRGLRICVNNDGDRMDYSVLENNFHSINTLTVVASESYDSFAKALQTEISTPSSKLWRNSL